MSQNYSPDTAPLAEDTLDGAADTLRAKPRKAPNAFRTISEVADDLHIPQHVLRFWETKFPQVKPLKRGGGRRYYRPDDIALLRRISDLLYIQGYTIKGVQRLLREGGGKLSDEIPPPRPDEQIEMDEVQASDEPQLPMPGILTAESEAPSRAMRTARVAAPTKAEASDVQRLRSLLARALAELEELRTKLG